jgi:hypothetical protein
VCDVLSIQHAPDFLKLFEQFSNQKLKLFSVFKVCKIIEAGTGSYHAGASFASDKNEPGAKLATAKRIYSRQADVVWAQ